MWMQLVGEPPLSARCSRDKMNEILLGRLIGQGGTVHWPSRSPI